ncbi:MAG TPA: hypothetical protein VME41_01500 [Stellaceae bacterium]|nr:hypothetical protein [Stellaceae bacterium]
MLKRLAVAALLVLIAAPVLAQNPPPLQRLRGTVEKLAGDTLTIRTQAGTDANVALTPKTRIQTLVRKRLSDIKPGDFLASTGIKGTDGRIHAIEVRIFPRPTPDGGRQFPWDLGSNSVMTNAMVGTVNKSPEGDVVHVKFKGGESEYSIGPNVPILAPAPGDRRLLKPGKAVFVGAARSADGALTAVFMYVEKNGVKPPM